MKLNKISKTAFKFYNKKIFFSIGKKPCDWSIAPRWSVEVYYKGELAKTIESCVYPKLHLDSRYYRKFKGPFLTWETSFNEHITQLPLFSEYRVILDENFDVVFFNQNFKKVGTIKIYYN